MTMSRFLRAIDDASNACDFRMFTSQLRKYCIARDARWKRLCDSFVNGLRVKMLVEDAVNQGFSTTQ